MRIFALELSDEAFMNWQTAITMLGWFVTAALQVWILVKQRRLDRELATHKFLVPRAIDQLDEFAKWVSNGYELFNNYEDALIETVHQMEEDELVAYNDEAGAAKQDYLNWDRQVLRYVTYASQVWDKHYGGDLAGLISKFSETLRFEFQEPPEKLLLGMAKKAEKSGRPRDAYKLAIKVTTLHGKIISQIDSYIKEASR
jgi:hypothetical protein